MNVNVNVNVKRGARDIVCALHGVSPRDRWLCVLPGGQMNVNVNVNYTARATLQYKAQKETPGPAQAFSRRLVGIGVIFVADNFTGVQFS